MINNLIETIGKVPKFIILIISVLIIITIGTIDFYVKAFISFSLFYIIAIFLAGWFIGRISSLVLSFISAATWLLVDLFDKNVIADFLRPSFNAIIMFIFYTIVALLISSLKAQLDTNEKIARFDFLTGLVNPRHFYELAQAEIDRSNRYNSIFSVAYIDLDNFKFINDNYGHLIGDALLRIVADIMKENLRKTDTIARLGGDEFIILLPETDYQESRFVINKIENELERSMLKKNWPVTMSIGLVTCRKIPVSPDELIKLTDNLMYSAKKEGKNRIKHHEYKETSQIFSF